MHQPYPVAGQRAGQRVERESREVSLREGAKVYEERSGLVD